MTELNQDICLIVEQIECFDVECEAAQCTDLDDLWGLLYGIRDRLRAHLTVVQRAAVHAAKERTRREVAGE
jgi:hypothetical protein